MSEQKVLIIGLGAIGSIYAEKFHKCDKTSCDVLVTEERFLNYQENPLIFNDETLYLNYVLPKQVSKKADLIIVATKNDSIFQAAQMIEPFVKEDTVIISLLNGLSSEKILIEKFGEDKVLYSYYLGNASVRSGRIVNYMGDGTIYFGEKDNCIYSENVLKVKQLFDLANIDYIIPDDMISSVWYKFAVNVGINQASAAMMADYYKLQTDQQSRKLVKELIQEAVEIARALGVNGHESFIDKTFAVIDKMPPELKSSMFQDIENKRMTEVDIFAGEVIKLGKELGIKTPVNDFVYSKIKEIESKFTQTEACLCKG